MKQPKTGIESRRGFLKGIAVAGAGAGAVAAGGLAPVAAVADTGPRHVSGARGYQVTDHVLAYYRSAAL